MDFFGPKKPIFFYSHLSSRSSSSLPDSNTKSERTRTPYIDTITRRTRTARLAKLLIVAFMTKLLRFEMENKYKYFIIDRRNKKTYYLYSKIFYQLKILTK